MGLFRPSGRRVELSYPVLLPFRSFHFNIGDLSSGRQRDDPRLFYRAERTKWPTSRSLDATSSTSENYGLSSHLKYYVLPPTGKLEFFTFVIQLSAVRIAEAVEGFLSSFHHSDLWDKSYHNSNLKVLKIGTSSGLAWWTDTIPSSCRSPLLMGT